MKQEKNKESKPFVNKFFAWTIILLTLTFAFLFTFFPNHIFTKQLSNFIINLIGFITLAVLIIAVWRLWNNHYGKNIQNTNKINKRDKGESKT